MSWAKLDDQFEGHPKVEALLEHDEQLGSSALTLWLMCLCRAARNLTDGYVSRRAARAVYSTEGRVEDAAAELVRVGLWEEAAGGWLIHDYLVYNPSREEVLERREAARVRQKEHRAKKRREEERKQRRGRRPGPSESGEPYIPVPESLAPQTDVTRRGAETSAGRWGS